MSTPVVAFNSIRMNLTRKDSTFITVKACFFVAPDALAARHSSKNRGRCLKALLEVEEAMADTDTIDTLLDETVRQTVSEAGGAAPARK